MVSQDLIERERRNIKEESKTKNKESDYMCTDRTGREERRDTHDTYETSNTHNHIRYIDVEPSTYEREGQEPGKGIRQKCIPTAKELYIYGEGEEA